MAQHGDHAAGQALPGGHASRLHDHHAVREARRAPPTRPPARATRPPACARHPPARLRAPPTRPPARATRPPARAMHTRCTRHARATMRLRRAHALRVPCRRAHRASAAQHARRGGGMLPAEPRPPRRPPRAAAPGRAPRAASWGGGHRQIAGRGGSMAGRRWPLLERRAWPGIEGSPSPPNHHLWPCLWRARDAHHGSARVLLALGK